MTKSRKYDKDRVGLYLEKRKKMGLLAVFAVFAVFGAGMRVLVRLQHRARQDGRQPEDWQVWGLLTTAIVVTLGLIAMLIVFGSSGLIFMVAVAVGYTYPEIVASRHFPRVALGVSVVAVFLLVPELRAPLMSLALLVGILIFLVRGTMFPAKKKNT